MASRKDMRNLMRAKDYSNYYDSQVSNRVKKSTRYSQGSYVGRDINTGKTVTSSPVGGSAQTTFISNRSTASGSRVPGLFLSQRTSNWSDAKPR